jgi:hypothetical protein
VNPAGADESEVSVGPGLMLSPSYPGALELRLSPIPSLDISCDDRIYWLCRDKAGGTSKPQYDLDYLHNRRIELPDCGFGESIIVHLPLADRVHQFDAGRMMRAHRKSLKPIIGLMMRFMAR